MAKARKAAKKAKPKRKIAKKAARAKAKPSVRGKKAASRKPAIKQFPRELSPLKELMAQVKAPILLPPPATEAPRIEPAKASERIEPETIAPSPKQATQISVPGKGAPLTVSFDLVAPWQDKGRLSSFMKDEGISFTAESAGGETSAFLSSAADAGAQGYFIIRAQQAGSTIGAIDGYLTPDSVVFMRSKAQAKKRRELHTLLYCAAMTLLKARNPDPKAAIYICPRAPFSQDLAGKLLFLGRRAGMQAIPVESQGMLFFIRRFGKERELMADGKEMADILRGIKTLFPLEGVIGELDRAGPLQLIPLPTSPDSRDRLHELKDAILSLGIEAPNLDEMMERLKDTYVYDRKDVIPESI